MLFKKRQSPQETVRVYCPVCPVFLGTKKRGVLKSFNCPDCKHTYYFYAFDKKKPRGVPTKHKKDKQCNCGRTPWCGS